MSGPPLHPMFHHFSEMPYSQRTLFTATLLVLAMGYLFALTLIFVTYAGRAGDSPCMLSYQDLVVAYSGSGQASRLESALSGPMRTMLPPDESEPIINWLHQGVTRAAFTSTVKPIIEKRCLICHDGSNPHIPNLTGYDNVKKVTEADTGTPVATLIRVSHIHLFGNHDGLLRHGLDVQPRLCPAGLAQMLRHRDAVRCNGVGHQLVVFHQAVPSVRAGW